MRCSPSLPTNFGEHRVVSPPKIVAGRLGSPKIVAEPLTTNCGEQRSCRMNGNNGRAKERQATEDGP